MAGLVKEFRDFAVRGNVMELAIAFIFGAAFSPIVSSLVNDIIMPPIGLLLGKVDFANMFVVLAEGKVAPPYATLAAAKEAGAVTINYGAFINVIITFLIVALVLFFIVKALNAAKRPKPAPAAPPTKECPFCASTIPIKANRCPHCTSQLQTM